MPQPVSGCHVRGVARSSPRSIAACPRSNRSLRADSPDGLITPSSCGWQQPSELERGTGSSAGGRKSVPLVTARRLAALHNQRTKSPGRVYRRPNATTLSFVGYLPRLLTEATEHRWYTRIREVKMSTASPASGQPSSRGRLTHGGRCTTRPWQLERSRLPPWPADCPQEPSQGGSGWLAIPLLRRRPFQRHPRMCGVNLTCCWATKLFGDA